MANDSGGAVWGGDGAVWGGDGAVWEGMVLSGEAFQPCLRK